MPNTAKVYILKKSLSSYVLNAGIGNFDILVISSTFCFIGWCLVSFFRRKASEKLRTNANYNQVALCGSRIYVRTVEDDRTFFFL